MINLTTSPKCSTDTVYFQSDILPILSSNCAYSGCHNSTSAKDGVILDTYQNIMKTGEVKPFKATKSELYKVLVETDLSDIMPPPPSSALSAGDIQKIKKWIDQGAKFNSCSDCDTVNATYSGRISQIMAKNCTGCHNANSAYGGVQLHSYSTVQIEVKNSNLLGTINHQAGYKPMPPSGVKISDCEINAVKKWISNGAQND